MLLKLEVKIYFDKQIVRKYYMNKVLLEAYFSINNSQNHKRT